MTPDRAAVRIDLWLHHVCLVKHRNEATEACRGGHVTINGRRAKASSLVREGDVIELSTDRRRVLVVTAVPLKQASRQMGREMYRDESPAPDPTIDRVDLPGAGRRRGAGRPTKQERREIERLRTTDRDPTGVRR